MSEQIEHDLTDAPAATDVIGAGGALEDAPPSTTRAESRPTEPAPASAAGQPAAAARSSRNGISPAAGTVLPDSAELELRGRMTELERAHNGAVGAIRTAQLLALAALVLAAGLLYVIRQGGAE